MPEINGSVKMWEDNQRKVMRANAAELAKDTKKNNGDMKLTRTGYKAYLDGIEKPFITQCPHHQEFISYSGKFMTALKCRLCGCIIGGLVELGDVHKKEKINNQIVITKYVTFSHFALYVGIELKLGEGRSHLTFCCKSCLADMTLEKAETLWISDQLQWHAEEKEHGHEVPWEQIKDLHVTGFTEVKLEKDSE